MKLAEGNLEVKNTNASQDQEYFENEASFVSPPIQTRQKGFANTYGYGDLQKTASDSQSVGPMSK